MNKAVTALLIGLVITFAGPQSAEACNSVKQREMLTKAVLNMKDLKASGATERQMLETVGREEDLPLGLKAALYEGISYVFAPAEHSISLIVQQMQFACEDAAR